MSNTFGLGTSVSSSQITALKARLKEAGQRGLSREINKALREAARPIVLAEQQAALGLPAAGPDSTGLRQELAAGVGVVQSRGRVRIRDRARLARATQSRRGWRHPVFGNRDVWVTESLRPGWFDSTAFALKPQAVQKVTDAVVRMAQRIARG